MTRPDEDLVADLRDQLATRDRRIALLEAQLADSERLRTTAVDMWRESMRGLAPRPRPRCDCPVELDGTRLKQPDCPRHGAANRGDKP